jgi:uncharacterized protein YndB with AHSA1/START domain
VTIAPVVVEVEVPLDPQAAFALFTEQVGTWWPLETHSVFGRDAVDVRFPACADGPIVEVSSAGEESTWGTVQQFDPPALVRFTWHPGRLPDTAQEVEVAFTPTSRGTAVRLVHTGWEAAGGRAAEIRDDYATGWVGVLDRFTAAVPVRR